ncbi:MAG TPA: DUF2914 domain-containing protein [Desulfatiglandales bacterium]|nr:DUF2914 domain-containing protein [Desulfatiglandales bacterium]
MKTKSLFGILVIFLLPVLAIAQEAPTITVEDIQICTSVEDRQPVGADTSFARDIGKLYCFTKLNSDQDTASISHVWYYNDKEMLRVELDVRAKKWRTWSTKRIIDTWTGTWRVDVLLSDGNVLSSKEFTITE